MSTKFETNTKEQELSLLRQLYDELISENIISNFDDLKNIIESNADKIKAALENLEE